MRSTTSPWGRRTDRRAWGLSTRAISADSTITRVDGPPDPMMSPVRSLEISSGSRPASWIACSIATWFHAAPPPRKRIARRSTNSSGLRLGAPSTWQRKPSSAYFSAREDARFGLAQAREHFLRRGANRGHDPHAGDDDTPHAILLNDRRADPYGVRRVGGKPFTLPPSWRRRTSLRAYPTLHICVCRRLPTSRRRCRAPVCLGTRA